MKEEKLYYSIREASEILGISYAHLHHLEREIPELKILRTPKGRRLYNPGQLEILKNIIYLTREKGLSIQTAGAWAQKTKGNTSQLLKTIETLKKTKTILEELKSKLESYQKG